jgi:hypothetical protein
VHTVLPRVLLVLEERLAKDSWRVMPEDAACARKIYGTPAARYQTLMVRRRG